MAAWIKCTNKDGDKLHLNLDHVAVIRPYHRDRGFTGNEVIFAAGNLTSIIVMESEDYLTGSGSAERQHGEV
jgi:hypothetical protein